MVTLHCPICDRTFEAADSAALPFCSHRCRQIDLGRWLREDYGIPVERWEAEEDADTETEDDF